MPKSICFLVPDRNETLIRKYYLHSIPDEEAFCIPLWFDSSKKKTSATDMRNWFKEEVEPQLENCKYLCICNADYFKVLTGNTKAEPYIGYVFNSLKYYTVYVPTYKTYFTDPEGTREKINLSINALLAHIKGTYVDPGSSIIKTAIHPSTEASIENELNKLHSYEKLTCDIETWSLKHYDAGLASICFCWNQHEGISFRVDNKDRTKNESIRSLLRNFFEEYKGTLIFHNITFDVYVLIYQLFMKDLIDYKGLLYGLEVFNKYEDTMIITYLATNSCAGNTLGLKALSREYTGNYAQEEIDNLDAISTKDLLTYNLTDGLATWYVYNKYYDKMIGDQQLSIYNTIFKPAVKDIIQMQLIGMPISMQRVLEVEKLLQTDQDKAISIIRSSSLVQAFEEKLKEQWVEEKNRTFKKKRVTINDCKLTFNPDSSKQLKELLYTELNLPIIDYTDSKEPATGKDVLAKLINTNPEPEVKELLQALIDYKDVVKILSAFIPAFKKAQKDKEGNYHLYGNFHLCGTVSGRLSSSHPNMQNLPATGSKYAKVIKSCFIPPKDWLFIGLDFSSLEDRISALTTKDPQKLKVYTDHYDGHCLRAYSYFKDQMPDITEALKAEPEKEVEIINSIKDKHKDLRQRGKSETFALTYGSSAKGLVKNLGCSLEEAEQAFKAYHELYKVSDEWVAQHIKRAELNGYVTCAFGLRVRTPCIRQTVLGTKVTPKEAEAEKRTAGNALGQSWCMLTSRAGIEFNQRVRESEYKYDILPVLQVHDAQYFLVRDDPDILLWTNKYLVKAISWQEDPNIAHDEVKLTGELSVFYPDWSHELVIPNDCNKDKLFSLVQEYLRSLNA